MTDGRDSLREEAPRRTLGAAQAADDPNNGDVNYYVVLPFTTVEGALWVAGEVPFFDCYVVSRVAVDQEAHVIQDESHA